eukprot:2097939-Prymnesium_polylepis.1
MGTHRFATHSRKFLTQVSWIRDAFAKVLHWVCTGFAQCRTGSRKFATDLRKFPAEFAPVHTHTRKYAIDSQTFSSTFAPMHTHAHKYAHIYTRFASDHNKYLNI